MKKTNKLKFKSDTGKCKVWLKKNDDGYIIVMGDGNAIVMLSPETGNLLKAANIDKNLGFNLKESGEIKTG